MSIVSIPCDGASRPRLRARTVRVASIVLIAGSLGGLALVGPIEPQSADAATATSSELTVKWTDTSIGDTRQPIRNPRSPHYAEFEKLKVTVSQTTGIIDQAIRVSVTGFAGTESYYRSGITADNAKNYLQAMQCWGPDPLADDFNETCQWGGRGLVPNSGLSTSVIPDNALRVSSLDLDPNRPTNHDVPFRTVDKQTISGKPVLKDGVPTYQILNYFNPATTNEVVSARVGRDGTGFFDFETQSSDQAPQLGCGTAAHLRCWLVIVPRGTVFGGDGAECSGIKDPANGNVPYTKGRVDSVQGGSPVNDKCDYFANRIVVPLDFTPTGSTCSIGSTEFRVVGSQLMVGAMSSWQPSLCRTVKSTFSFSTNADSFARSQIIETSANAPRIGFTGYPVASGELLSDSERTTLANSQLRYAPVAISSVVVAFVAEGFGGREQELNISPRIMAKILTQSYKFTVPYNSADPEKNLAHLPAANLQYEYLRQDPEFQQLNPTNFDKFEVNPGIVLPGPSGADAVKQVWRWIFADRDAVAFLNGAADPSGMTINPYYLPRGDPKAVVPWWLDEGRRYIGEVPTQRLVGLTNLDGTPRKFTDSVPDTFPKNDESIVPLNPVLERYRFDSIQFSPYANDILAGARTAFRADPNSKTIWDPGKVSASGDVGDWVSGGAQPPGARFMLAITDSVSAARYGLDTAGIQVPNTSTLARASEDSMSSALVGLAPTSLDNVKQIDPALVTKDGYPMTMVTYAGVNVGTASATQRATIASMLKQVTSSGQISGAEVGQLPVGYLPLTPILKAQADAAITSIEAYIPPAKSRTPFSAPISPGSALGEDEFFPANAPGSLDDIAAGPEITTGVDQISTDATAASATDLATRPALAIALAIGLTGFLIAPLLLRRRGFL